MQLKFYYWFQMFDVFLSIDIHKHTHTSYTVISNTSCDDGTFNSIASLSSWFIDHTLNFFWLILNVVSFLKCLCFIHFMSSNEKQIYVHFKETQDKHNLNGTICYCCKRIYFSVMVWWKWNKSTNRPPDHRTINWVNIERFYSVVFFKLFCKRMKQSYFYLLDVKERVFFRRIFWTWIIHKTDKRWSETFCGKYEVLD